MRMTIRVVLVVIDERGFMILMELPNCAESGIFRVTSISTRVIFSHFKSARTRLSASASVN